MAQVESVTGVPNGDRDTESVTEADGSPGGGGQTVQLQLSPSNTESTAVRVEVDGKPEEANVSPSTKMVAPALRVEELREEDGNSSSSYLSVSEEEGGLSPGEASAGEDASSKEFVPPDDALKEQITKQVEFYFSDVNILKDAFLLKHVRRNKQGYVSLKLITSFRKVKKMTKDYRVVAYSLRDSDQLELNEEGSKVRRKLPLPDFDETTPSRTVVAVNLPIENPTVETVAELFTKCGDIALVRILKPGKPLPPDVKRHINKHPELGNAVCAVVEFENHSAAKKACEDMTSTDDWRKGLRVVLLAQQKKDKSAKDKTADKSREKTPDKNKVKNDVTISPGNADNQQTLTKSTENIAESDHKGDTPEEAISPKDEDDEQPFEEVTREGHRQRKKRGGRKGRVTELVKRETGTSAASSGSEAEGADASSWRGHKRNDSGGSYNGRASLSPHADPDAEGPDSASWRSKRRGSGGSFSGRASLSPHTDPNRLSPCTTPRTTPRSSPKSSPRSSPRGSPVSRRRMLGKSPLAADSLSPGTSPKPSPCGSPEARRKNSVEESGSSPSSPWVQRRLKAQQELGSPLAGTSPGASPRLVRRMANMEGVVRQPHGPDGTRGFGEGVGRGKTRSDTM